LSCSARSIHWARLWQAPPLALGLMLAPAAAVEVDRARGADAAVAVAAAKQHGIIELVATHRALQRLLPQVRSRRSVRPIECTELRA
jgi:hypothetical protein